MASGKCGGALPASILQALIDGDPGNASLRRELAVSLNKIGDAQFSMGQPEPALAAYRAGLEIISPLAAAEPKRTSLQRDLTFTLNKVADALALLGQRAEALATFRRSLDITERLAADEPQEVLWQSDLAFSHTRIGMLRRLPASARRRSRLT